MPNWLRNVEEVFAVLDGAIPELPQLLEAAEGQALYVVGGTVRDLMLGRGRTDLDVAVEGDAAAVARRLGGEVTEHGRFGTAKVRLPGSQIDLAATRAEIYTAPGALPEVRPAGIEEDLARRDFTVNAMALALGDEPRLIDPHGGREDLREGVLRALHPDSLRDDPTRALRGARYAARFGLVPDPETERQLRETDLATISEDRRRAEMERIAAEPDFRAALDLLREWGLLEVPRERLALAEKVAELLAAPPWSAVLSRERAICCGPGRARRAGGAARRRLPGDAVGGSRAGARRLARGPRAGPRIRRRLARRLHPRVALGRARDRRP